MCYQTCIGTGNLCGYNGPDEVATGEFDLAYNIYRSEQPTRRTDDVPIALSGQNCERSLAVACDYRRTLEIHTNKHRQIEGNQKEKEKRRTLLTDMLFA